MTDEHCISHIRARHCVPACINNRCATVRLGGVLKDTDINATIRPQAGGLSPNAPFIR